MADQLAAAHLPAYGNSVVHAPRLDGARARGRRLRERLLRVAAVRPVALRAAGRPPAVGDRRLRQRRRAAGRHADDRPRAARRRLRDDARRQDALRRPGSAARLRGAPDDRRLSRPGSTGRPTGGCPVGERLEWYHNTDEPARRARRRGGHADRLRRRGLLPRRAEDPRPLPARGRAAVLPDRLVHEPARPVGDPAALLGSLRRATRSTCPRSGRCRATRPMRTACACAT